MALATEREDISLDVVAVEVGCERLFFSSFHRTG